MKLHIFNPGHDAALANGNKYFTPPHAARQLMADMGYLPAVWAEDGDAVLVENVDAAREQARHIGRRLHRVSFVAPESLRSLRNIEQICPWGWDSQIVFKLARWGVDRSLMPSDDRLSAIRALSSRATAIKLLPKVSTDEKAWMVESTAEFGEKLSQLGSVVAKEPWSSSGRGVRYITSGTLTPQIENWLSRVIETEGGIAVEPYYNKVVDFGMEFTLQGGECKYVGLSVFNTQNGFYTGNIIAKEELKQWFLTKYVALSELERIRTELLTHLSATFGKAYSGPVGVDMMVYSDAESRLHIHPMVEINLRRTMGHVAISLQKTLIGDSETMNVEYRNNRYKLRITKNKSK